MIVTKRGGDNDNCVSQVRGKCDDHIRMVGSMSVSVSMRKYPISAEHCHC